MEGTFVSVSLLLVIRVFGRIHAPCQDHVYPELKANLRRRVHMILTREHEIMYPVKDVYFILHSHVLL